MECVGVEFDCIKPECVGVEFSLSNPNVLALNLVVNAPYRIAPMRRCNSEETYVVHVVPDRQDSCSDLTQDEEKHQHRVLEVKKEMGQAAVSKQECPLVDRQGESPSLHPFTASPSWPFY